MAEGTSKPAGAVFAQGLSRLAWLSSVGAAIILGAVLLGNAAIVVLNWALDFWLIALVQIGPGMAVFLANFATIANYYGSVQVLRGKADYEAKDDLKQEALSAPAKAQGLPNTLRSWLGCQSILSVGVLVASLAVFAATEAPPPLQLLGVVVPGPQPSPTATAAVASPTPTLTPTPTETPTPTPVPIVQFVVSPLDTTQTCNAVPAFTVTLDNTQSNVAVDWSVRAIENAPGATTPWASADPSTGTVPAGGTASFVMTPDAQHVCTLQTQQIYHAQIDLTSGSGSITVSDTINPYLIP
jgi:hypothetical protein